MNAERRKTPMARLKCGGILLTFPSAEMTSRSFTGSSMMRRQRYRGSGCIFRIPPTCLRVKTPLTSTVSVFWRNKVTSHAKREGHQLYICTIGVLLSENEDYWASNPACL